MVEILLFKSCIPYKVVAGTYFTYFIFKQTADGNFPAILRQNISPELARLHGHQTQALGAGIMDMGSLFDLMIFDDGADLFLLTGRQLVPERQIFRKFHGLRLLSNSDSIRSADGYVKWKSPGNQTAAPRRKLLLIDQKIK